MKRLISGATIIVLIFAVFLGLTACTKPEPKPAEPTPPVQPQPPAPQPPVQPQAGTTAPNPAAISADKYWTIMLDRLEVTKKYYQESLAIYKKYPNEVEKANPELMELRKSVQQQMQKVFTDNGMNMAQDFFPKGPDRMQVQQERAQYIKDHPELEQKYKALRDEMNTLRTELMQFTGHGMPGAGGHPPM